jgi:hypothetical protein
MTLACSKVTIHGSCLDMAGYMQYVRFSVISQPTPYLTFLLLRFSVRFIC